MLYKSILVVNFFVSKYVELKMSTQPYVLVFFCASTEISVHDVYTGTIEIDPKTLGDFIYRGGFMSWQGKGHINLI